MTKKVFIVGGYDSAYANMFKERGWGIASSMDEADLLQFTGGEDVSPDLYNELRHPLTGNNPVRDAMEKKVYLWAVANGIPMAGICRGGQFLNVMNGGKMWQDVDNHAIGRTHRAFAVGHIGWVNVTSTHHQMMRVNTQVEHLTLMTAKESTYRENVGSTGIVLKNSQFGGKFDDDVESVYYPNTLTLCYQPHPEFNQADECRDVYFYFINNYLMAELNVEQAVTLSKQAWSFKDQKEEEKPKGIVVNSSSWTGMEVE